MLPLIGRVLFALIFIMGAQACRTRRSFRQSARPYLDNLGHWRALPVATHARGAICLVHNGAGPFSVRG